MVHVWSINSGERFQGHHGPLVWERVKVGISVTHCLQDGGHNGRRSMNSFCGALCQCPTDLVNPLPDDKILVWSNLEQIADDILKCI